MAPYLYGVRNDAHIIDLQQTVPMLHRALAAVRDIVAGGGRVLFVGTKRQAAEPVAAAAKRCGQFYVNHRWLGGMLTNWKTISVSIRRLHTLEAEFEQEQEQTGLTKKELLRLNRERNKLERSLGGIKDMGGLPDLLFVIDTNREAIAIAEANKLGIPVVAVIDSNSDPDKITYPIPGNDDAIRAVNLYCKVMSEAVLDGIQEEVIASGGDIGAHKDAPHEALSEESGKSGDEPTDSAAGEAAPPATDEAAPPSAGEAAPPPATGEAPPATEEASPATDDAAKIDEASAEAATADSGADAKADTGAEKKAGDDSSAA